MTHNPAVKQILAQQYQTILHTEQAAEQARLEEYRDTLRDLTQQYAQTRARPSKPLTIPAIFGRSHRENFISDYLAYILNPVKNGLGPALTHPPAPSQFGRGSLVVLTTALKSPNSHLRRRPRAKRGGVWWL